MDVRTWVDRQRETHARLEQAELRRLAAMSTAERVELPGSLCRDASALLEAMPEHLRARAVQHRDALPPSSLAALARLRAASGQEW